MFGYVVCHKKSLSKEEQDRYRSVYCGLCHTIRKKFGKVERFTLSYDMTFLVLFLSALYEAPEKSYIFRCPANPAHKRKGVAGIYMDYAADMTILYSYYKFLDDWKDEKSSKARARLLKLREPFLHIEKKYPRQAGCLKDSIKALMKLEKNKNSRVDDYFKISGRMMTELFVYKEDFWSNSLRYFGYELGRFIYLMDAACDYRKDIKTGNYNPLMEMGKLPAEVESLLQIILGNATEEFEKLPIIQDGNLLRNILYGGIWQQYFITVLGKEKQIERSL